MLLAAFDIIRNMITTKRADNKAACRTQTRTRRHIVVGDVHGELEGLKEILSHARIIDDRGTWSGKKSVLVQTGDVIDRGPHSVEAVRFLQRLQEQAEKVGGRVVRLCGNHELLLIQEDYYFTDLSEPEEMARQLREEILAGRVLASYTDGTRLYTHAGLRTKIRQAVEETHTGCRRKGLQGLSERLNRIFVACLKEGDLETHPIFYRDEVRGGPHEIGGIFWGDYSGIRDSVNTYGISQVFGHTPTLKDEVEHSHGLRMIDIDAGIFRGYGGHRVFLEIDCSGAVTEHALMNRQWRQKTLISGI